ncbi:MAG TPA: efflux RND transporter periplasmic adaptor subunit, partial [Hyphomicrobium sp.]|nr:efflux RND transporter periplasmic adaptor subunit [Hyphomicrobium sp.]
MKRLGLVAGSLFAGTLVGAHFFPTERFALEWKDLLGFETPADAVESSAHADHGHAETSASAHGAEVEGAHEEENNKLTIAPDQIERSEISVQPVQSGVLQTRLRVPGTIIPDRNKVGRVPSKVVGTVAELKKGLGDSVEAGEVIAILDSREVADAKSEYIAAIV